MLTALINKYSLSAESYGITKTEWREIKYDVQISKLKSEQVEKIYKLDSKQLWFLYDILLQEKYNHLYKRDKLVNPKVNDFVYCDSVGYGRGVIKSFSLDRTLMMIKFDSRELCTTCIDFSISGVKVTRI